MASFYVSTTGSDSNPGSLAAPWRTIQKAANTLTAGSTVYVRGGIYSELVGIAVSGSSSGGFITFQSYAGEIAIIDGTSIGIGSGTTDVVLMDNSSYIRWMGFEIRNFRSSLADHEVNGISVYGTAHHIEILNNKIHHIESNAVVTSGGNAHAITVQGTHSTIAMTDILIDGNEVYNMRTGTSESVTVNGNVTNWSVTNNNVHDCNNIAIDAAGHYGVCPNATNDQARNGVIRGNIVTDIDSSHNPGYGGDFTYGGGGHAADGLYVDGGRDIIIERNIVTRANIGIEIASEHGGKATSYITVRDNVVVDSYNYGIAMGGYDTLRGSTVGCKVLNNTLFKNGALGGGSEIEVQYDTQNNIIKNNIIYGTGDVHFIHNDFTQNTGNVVDYNLYFSPMGAPAALFKWKNHSYSSWSDYQSTSGNDAHSQFADPKLVSAPSNMRLLSSSPAIGVGDSSVVAGGELDLDGQTRVQGGTVELGAYETSAGGGSSSHVTVSEIVSLIEAVAAASSSRGVAAIHEAVLLSEQVAAVVTSLGTPGVVSLTESVSLGESLGDSHVSSGVSGGVDQYPTVELNWQYDVGVDLGAQYDLTLALRTPIMMFQIKQTLIGFPLNPWVVVGSCDSIASGMDGVDRLTGPEKIVWPETEPSTGRPRSWVVCRNAAGLYLLLHFSITNAFMNGWISTEGFTGGSTTSRPTAPDEVPFGVVDIANDDDQTVGMNWTGGLGRFEADGAVNRLQVLHSVDGRETRVFVVSVDSYTPANQFVFALIIGEFGATTDGLTKPFYALFDDAVLAQAGMVWNAVHRLIGAYLPSGPALVSYATEHGYELPQNAPALMGVGPCLNGANEISGYWPFQPVYGFHRPPSGSCAVFGRMKDIWLGSTALDSGTTHPASGPSRFAQFGPWLVPWPDSLGAPVVT
jgi:hypothetical protein